jgi:hypothetical protein
MVDVLADGVAGDLDVPWIWRLGLGMGRALHLAVGSSYVRCSDVRVARDTVAQSLNAINFEEIEP